MPRPKKHLSPFSGQQQTEAAFREYLSRVADCFGGAYDDRLAGCGSGNQQSGGRGGCDGGEFRGLRAVCEEFNISIPKARKLLITAGVYSTMQSRRVAELYEKGNSVDEIMTGTGLSRSSVFSYLPYKKYFRSIGGISSPGEDSRKSRERAVRALHEKIVKGEEAKEALWETVIAFQNDSFYTSSGLPFTYSLKIGRNGGYTGELIVSRKEGSKTLTRSSVMLAFQKVLERYGECADAQDGGDAPEYSGPKAIGQIFGISYIYSMFWRFGVIRVPEKIENRLRGKA